MGLTTAISGSTLPWLPRSGQSGGYGCCIQIAWPLVFDDPDLGTILGGVSIVLAIIGIAYAAHSRSKRFGYEVAGNLVVQSNHQDVEVLYKGKRVPRVRRTVLTFKNFGSNTIPSGAVRTPIKIEFEQDAEILGAPRLIESTHSRLDPSLTPFDARTVQLGFAYAEPGDSMTIEILHTGRSLAPAGVECNIEGFRRGVSRLESRREPAKYSPCYS